MADYHEPKKCECSQVRLSPRIEHELLLKLAKAGLKEPSAQQIVNSKDNEAAQVLVRVLGGGEKSIRLVKAFLDAYDRVTLDALDGYSELLDALDLMYYCTDHERPGAQQKSGKVEIWSRNQETMFL